MRIVVQSQFVEDSLDLLSLAPQEEVGNEEPDELLKGNVFHLLHDRVQVPLANYLGGLVARRNQIDHGLRVDMLRFLENPDALLNILLAPLLLTFFDGIDALENLFGLLVHLPHQFCILLFLELIELLPLFDKARLVADVGVVAEELLDFLVDRSQVLLEHLALQFFLVGGVLDELVEDLDGFQADVLFHEVPVVQFEEVGQVFVLEDRRHLGEQGLQYQVPAHHPLLHQLPEVVDDHVGVEVEGQHRLLPNQQLHQFFVDAEASRDQVQVGHQLVGVGLDQHVGGGLDE